MVWGGVVNAAPGFRKGGRGMTAKWHDWAIDKRKPEDITGYDFINRFSRPHHGLACIHCGKCAVFTQGKDSDKPDKRININGRYKVQVWSWWYCEECGEAQEKPMLYEWSSKPCHLDDE